RPSADRRHPRHHRNQCGDQARPTPKTHPRRHGMTTNLVHKEIPMELDELKSAWQALDRKLERENSLRLDDLRDRKLGKVHDSLRPLFRGQVAQILFGIPFIALATLLWMT